MAFNPKISETFTAPTNIAVIKYWGKNDVKLNTPLNSSVSVTLDQADLHTITTVAASETFDKDRLWLNGEEVEINGRGQAVLKEIRSIAGDRIDPITGVVLVNKEDWSKYKVHIASVNTFPTGAGLASSAAGYACLTAALAELYCCKPTFDGQLTAIARQGSGSASRSLFGGLVRWQKGITQSGRDSIAVQIADENSWKELRAIILVVSDKEKDTSSTAGMETSKATSPLLMYRAKEVVEPRVAEIEKAFVAKDFETFGRLTMQDSNQFHATCLDTYPPIFYLNDVSKAIMRLVHVINEHFGRIVCAYTYDAGPNAVIYLLEKDTPLVMAVMVHFFPAPGTPADYCNDVDFFVKSCSNKGIIVSDLLKKLNKTGRIPSAGDVKYIFHTRSGKGPIRQPAEESLLDPSTGTPLPPGSEVLSRHKRMQIRMGDSGTAKSHGAGYSMFRCPFTWGLLTAAFAVGAITGFAALKHSKR